ncbi:radical SAM domain-containing protein [Tolypothrix sp. NIES-4075]|uniref:radical SAM/SPASM domain-containing protein n=1 Tax=Tolypothrix sp. NIES-4075 TaxID=2005459 RepID=UPI000B5C3B2A|nr:radical SAM protein [Tolypothrix sp. NIES-4075]GAX45435.1 radical SAM domain-containing protein [Tolypothrix sp. NIES-4075]
MKSFSWITGNDVSTREKLVSLVEREYSKLNENNELKTIYLFLTRKCNLGCQHCYIERGEATPKEHDFDLKTIKGIIDQALPYGLQKVKVSGGEPMVHKEFMDIINYLGGLGLKELVLETNGTLFKKDTISQLSAIPNLTIFISLDHPVTEAHDEFRGQTGAYEKTIGVLKELGQSKIPTIVTTTAYRDNYDKIPEIINLVLGLGITRHRTLLNIHPRGNARDHLDNAITLDECEVLVSQVIQSEYFAKGQVYVTLPPALMPLSQLTGIHACGWGDSVVGILSNGQVSMCSASYDDPEMIAGNIFEAPLIDIWHNSPFFAQLSDISLGNVKGVCSNCIFYKVCRGVCKMSSYSHYGEKDAPYPMCQEAYNVGAFPQYALSDPNKDCHYSGGKIKNTRESSHEALATSTSKI